MVSSNVELIIIKIKMENAVRQDGFYWCRQITSWWVYEWLMHTGKFYSDGDSFRESDFDEIYEERIVLPTEKVSETI